MPATVTFFHALNYLEGKLITRLAARHCVFRSNVITDSGGR